MAVHPSGVWKIFRHRAVLARKSTAGQFLSVLLSPAKRRCQRQSEQRRRREFRPSVASRPAGRAVAADSSLGLRRNVDNFRFVGCCDFQFYRSSRLCSSDVNLADLVTDGGHESYTALPSSLAGAAPPQRIVNVWSSARHVRGSGRSVRSCRELNQRQQPTPPIAPLPLQLLPSKWQPEQCEHRSPWPSQPLPRRRVPEPSPRHLWKRRQLQKQHLR